MLEVSLTSVRNHGGTMWRYGVLSILAILPVAPAAAELVVISRDDCARVVAHVPAPDVAYRPGVDTRGRAVAPADLDDTISLDLDADDIVIDIAVPLRAFPGTLGDETAFTDAGGKIARYGATADIGIVTLRGGLVYFNGQPISPSERERLAAACRGR